MNYRQCLLLIITLILPFVLFAGDAISGASEPLDQDTTVNLEVSDENKTDPDKSDSTTGATQQVDMDGSDSSDIDIIVEDDHLTEDHLVIIDDKNSDTLADADEQYIFKDEKEIEIEEIDDSKTVKTESDITEITEYIDQDDTIITNTQTKSSMIIFMDDYNSQPKSYSNRYEQNQSFIKKSSWAYMPDFIPGTPDEFYHVSVSYQFSQNDTIIPSKISISLLLGETIINQAYEYFKDGQIKNANSLFSKLFYYNYRPDLTAYYLHLCNYIQKDYISSINYLLLAIDLTPTHDKKTISEYYYHIGLTSFQIKNYSAALEYFQQSLELSPDLYKNYHGLGLVYYKTGNLNAALTSWEKGKAGGNKKSAKNWHWLKEKLAKK